METKSLQSKTIVITGASSGIGKAAALLFAQEGANLVLAARSETLLQEIASECESLGATAIAVATDVTDKDSVQHLFDNAMAFFNGIDVWINNAGVGAIGSFEETPIEAHEQVIRTNLLGALYGSHVVLPYFQKRGEGQIITTNSTGSFVGSPYSVAYSASKFGLRGLTEALRYEYQKYPGIHICDIYAGFVDSPGMSHAANYIGREVNPPKPLVDPVKVAKSMVALVKRPRKSIHLGGQDRLGRFGHFILPTLTGAIMEKVMRTYFKRSDRKKRTDGNLFRPDYGRSAVHGQN